MDRDAATAVVEAILLTARGPVRVESIAESAAEDGLDEAAVTAILHDLQIEWDSPGRGLRLESVAGDVSRRLSSIPTCVRTTASPLGSACRRLRSRCWRSSPTVSR